MTLSAYEWPRPHGFTPFDHQKTTSEFLITNRKAFCFNEQGTGKTASVIWAVDYLMRRGLLKRVLVVCPLSIMKSAWQQDLFKFAIHRTVSIAHGSAAKRKQIINVGSEFVIINFDGVGVVKNEILAGGFDLVVVDECFVAGTRVATPDGHRLIEQLQPGDKVLTSTGAQRINRIVRNTSTNLVTIRTSDGEETTCTAEHPFFTDAGWICAKHLVGRRLIREAELPDVSGNVFTRKKQASMVPLEGYERRVDLLTILRTEAVSRIKSGAKLLRKYASAPAWEFFRRGAFRGVQSQDVHANESQRAQTFDSGRQRYWDDCYGALSSFLYSYGLGMELPSSVGQEAAGLSYVLQAGLCGPDYEAGARSGWKLPQYDRAGAARPEEGSKASGTWVVSVTHHKHGSAAPVFNLEISGTPHYFANGNLVHNCTAYKNAQTDRWKVLRDLNKVIKGLWMLTGTPAAQSPADAYGLAKLVNPTAVSPFFGQFKDTVMNKVSTFRWVPKPDAQTTVHRILQPAIRFEKAQCLDLPPVTHVDREAPLTPQQNKFYQILKKQMLVEAAGEEVSAINAAVQLSKLLQIAGGAVYTDNNEVIEFDVSNRLNVVQEVIDESSHKVLVFIPFTHTIELLKKHLEKNNTTCAVINGAVSVNARADIVKDFQTTDRVKVLLIQPKAAAHGLTLTAADTIIWYAPCTSVETYLQANARIDRPGQLNNMTVVHISGCPVETKMYSLLRNNIDNHQKIIDLYKHEILS